MDSSLRLAALVLAAGLSTLPAAARAGAGAAAGPDRGAPLDPYDAALAEARQAAEAGRYLEASALLGAPAAAWPQDFPLQLARAYYLLRAGRYPEAAAGYRAALALAPDSAAAARGLDDALAGRGASSQAWLGIYAGGTGWSGHPSRGWLASGALALDAVVEDRWTLGLLYRGLVAPGASGAGRGRSSGTLDLSHEGQLWLGHAAPGWSLTLHGAAASSAAATSGALPQVYAYRGLGGAVSGALQLGLDWRASAALIAWEDQTSAQLEATAALPIGRHLSVLGGWRGQRLDGTVTGAALLGLAWSGPFTLSLRGEYGAQRRPWDLEGRALYGLPEELRAALRLQASAPLGGPVRGWLGADLERWRTPLTGGGTVDASAARLAAGLVLSF